MSVGVKAADQQACHQDRHEAQVQYGGEVEQPRRRVMVEEVVGARTRRAAHGVEVAARRGRGEPPPRRHEPARLLEDRLARDPSESAAEDELGHRQHDQQRHGLVLITYHRRDNQPERRRYRRQPRDDYHDLEPARTEQRARVGRGVAEHPQQRQDDALQDGDEAQHDQLGAQVGHGGQTDGALPQVDRALLDQLAYGARRPHQRRADDQDE
ncbi:MAG: hypothetical protein ABJA34_05615 [Pseudonocardiales bacterium]